jgi:hypothetical protein
MAKDGKWDTQVRCLSKKIMNEKCQRSAQFQLKAIVQSSWNENQLGQTATRGENY